MPARSVRSAAAGCCSCGRRCQWGSLPLPKLATINEARIKSHLQHFSRSLYIFFWLICACVQRGCAGQRRRGVPTARGALLLQQLGHEGRVLALHAPPHSPSHSSGVGHQGDGPSVCAQHNRARPAQGWVSSQQRLRAGRGAWRRAGSAISRQEGVGGKQPPTISAMQPCPAAWGAPLSASARAARQAPAGRLSAGSEASARRWRALRKWGACHQCLLGFWSPFHACTLGSCWAHHKRPL